MGDPAEAPDWLARAAALPPRLICQEHRCALDRDGRCRLCGVEAAIVRYSAREDAPDEGIVTPGGDDHATE